MFSCWWFLSGGMVCLRVHLAEQGNRKLVKIPINHGARYVSADQCLYIQCYVMKGNILARCTLGQDEMRTVT